MLTAMFDALHGAVRSVTAKLHTKEQATAFVARNDLCSQQQYMVL